MMQRKKGLGRGLDALLAGNDDLPDSQRQATLSIGDLQPGKYQPRTRMDPGSLEDLAASIKAQGLIQPISVRPVGGSGRFEIIAGERRWRAAQIAGLIEVPVLIRDIPDDAALAMSLIENIQREDLNPLEEAAGLQRLIDEFGMTHQQAADAVGRSRSATTNLLRLLQLAKPAQDLLMAGDIEMGHARAILAAPKNEQGRLAAEVADKGYSVRETERRVARELNPPTHKPAAHERSRDLVRLEEDLSDAIGATVKVSANRKGAGTVNIRFASLDQLDGILKRLRG
ncbi:MAG: ParB/RepB/Spo0J family partition protein [Rhodocyclaceae bacterium]|nr:ParB/RepB/Spo0J family partition protein [Rhodocyclaceae bacterium]